jgi:membrane protease YdiL (CAAX protease family)
MTSSLARSARSAPVPPARDRLGWFVAAALGFTWVLQLPAALVKVGVLPGPIERFVPLAALGGFGPCVAALWCARAEPGGVRALLARFAIWRVPLAGYALALGLFPAVYVLGVGVYALCGGDAHGIWFFTPENTQQRSALLLVPVIEEIGWRGYALPRLQRRYSPLVAAVLLGVVWSLYHALMLVLQDVHGVAYVLVLVEVAVGSLLFSWIYNRTRGSLLLAVIAHASVHLNNPMHALPDALPLAIQCASICACAALCLLDRSAWHDPQPEHPAA